MIILPLRLIAIFIYSSDKWILLKSKFDLTQIINWLCVKILLRQNRQKSFKKEKTISDSDV